MSESLYRLCSLCGRPHPITWEIDLGADGRHYVCCVCEQIVLDQPHPSITESFLSLLEARKNERGAK